jgi:hypothetical protein
VTYKSFWTRFVFNLYSDNFVGLSNRRVITRFFFQVSKGFKNPKNELFQETGLLDFEEPAWDQEEERSDVAISNANKDKQTIVDCRYLLLEAGVLRESLSRAEAEIFQMKQIIEMHDSLIEKLSRQHDEVLRTANDKVAALNLELDAMRQRLTGEDAVMPNPSIDEGLALCEDSLLVRQLNHDKEGVLPLMLETPLANKNDVAGPSHFATGKSADWDEWS